MNYAVINNYDPSKSKVVKPEEEDEQDDSNVEDGSYVNYGFDDGSDQVTHSRVLIYNILIEI